MRAVLFVSFDSATWFCGSTVIVRWIDAHVTVRVTDAPAASPRIVKVPTPWTVTTKTPAAALPRLVILKLVPVTELTTRSGCGNGVTVIVKLPLRSLPCASRAVQVTVVEPTGKTAPDAGPQVGVSWSVDRVGRRSRIRHCRALRARRLDGAIGGKREAGRCGVDDRGGERGDGAVPARVAGGAADGCRAERERRSGRGRAGHARSAVGEVLRRRHELDLRAGRPGRFDRQRLRDDDLRRGGVDHANEEAPARRCSPARRMPSSGRSSGRAGTSGPGRRPALHSSSTVGGRLEDHARASAARLHGQVVREPERRRVRVADPHDEARACDVAGGIRARAGDVRRPTGSFRPAGTEQSTVDLAVDRVACRRVVRDRRACLDREAHRAERGPAPSSRRR